MATVQARQIGNKYGIGTRKALKPKTLKKYVPFNADWHVPVIIYKHMKERKCLIFQNGKGPRGEKIKVKKVVPELSIQLLSPLTGKEIKDLATQQAMANNLDQQQYTQEQLDV